ncbi:MAG: hypothetical protein IT422_13925 [Pirellulaceae bacterium]|jgi:hypothetical protein|nr:hypothetical protein [Pirellulaceae bacterium]
MISTLTPHSAEQKLASCSSRQEVWKKDHELAMALYKFEDLLGDMVELFDEIERFDRYYRQSLFASPNSYSEEVDRRLKALSRQYLDLMIDIEQTTLKTFQGFVVDRRQAFESCLNKAKLSAMHDFDMEAEIDYRTKLPSLDYCTELRTPIEEWPE